MTNYEIQFALEEAFVEAEKSDRTIERALHFRATMIRLKQDLTALIDETIAQQDANQWYEETKREYQYEQ